MWSLKGWSSQVRAQREEGAVLLIRAIHLHRGELVFELRVYSTRGLALCVLGPEGEEEKKKKKKEQLGKTCAAYTPGLSQEWLIAKCP